MRFGEAISLALTSLRSNKLRSLLTLLGVVIGIASVIIILTLGNALQGMASDALASAGGADYEVRIQSRPTDDASENAEPGDPEFDFSGFEEDTPQSELITPQMITDLRAHMGSTLGGVLTAGMANQMATATPGRESVPEVQTNLYTITEDELSARNKEILWGRGISPTDVTYETQVVVMNEDGVDKLFPGQKAQALGKSITIVAGSGSLTEYRLVGIVKNSSGIFAGNWGPEVDLYVPYTTTTALNPVRENLQTIQIRPAEGIDEQAFQQQAQGFFDEEYSDNPYYLAKVKKTDYGLDEIKQVLAGLSVGLGAIAGISLLVGGIGVMNIMLVTVTERTREIGIRKALGAKRRDILAQFVIEAMIIGLLGGVIGVVLGGSIGMIAAKLFGKLVFPPLTGVLFSLGFSLFVGLFFGYQPARRAAKLNPLDALRYE